jgi:hypothetical protein
MSESLKIEPELMIKGKFISTIPVFPFFGLAPNLAFG